MRIVVLLIFLLTTSAEAADFPTRDQVEVAVHRVMALHRKDIDARIKGLQDFNIVYHLSVCGYFSAQLGMYLRQDEGLNVYLINHPGHYNLGVMIKDPAGGDELIELIIDPTYRQFFTFNAFRARFDTNLLPPLFDQAKMPEILIVPASELKERLESFRLRPNWQVRPWDLLISQKEKKFFIHPTKYNYEYFYGVTKRSTNVFTKGAAILAARAVDPNYVQKQFLLGGGAQKIRNAIQVQNKGMFYGFRRQTEVGY